MFKVYLEEEDGNSWLEVQVGLSRYVSRIEGKWIQVYYRVLCLSCELVIIVLEVLMVVNCREMEVESKFYNENFEFIWLYYGYIIVILRSFVFYLYVIVRDDG